MATPRKAAPKKAAPKVIEAGEQSPAEVEAQAPDALKIVYTADDGATFEFEIPADPDDWPSLFHMNAASPNKNHRLWGVQALFGDQQWVRFITKFPARKHAVSVAELVAKHSGLGNAKN